MNRQEYRQLLAEQQAVTDSVNQAAQEQRPTPLLDLRHPLVERISSLPAADRISLNRYLAKASEIGAVVDLREVAPERFQVGVRMR